MDVKPKPQPTSRSEPLPSNGPKGAGSPEIQVPPTSSRSLRLPKHSCPKHYIAAPDSTGHRFDLRQGPTTNCLARRVVVWDWTCWCQSSDPFNQSTHHPGPFLGQSSSPQVMSGFGTAAFQRSDLDPPSKAFTSQALEW